MNRVKTNIIYALVLFIYSFIANTPFAQCAETNIDTPQPVSTSNTIQPTNHLNMLNSLLFSDTFINREKDILDKIALSKDTRFVAGLIDLLRYNRNLASEIGRILNELTCQDIPAYWIDWVEWAGKHPEIKSFKDYPTWKADLFRDIDSNFRRLIHPDMKIAQGTRLEEVVWGGVLLDGIPALDNPKMVEPGKADYLIPEELVFGVSINGDSRAYPTRFLDWHEMVNDVIGGEPVSLAYCTLCGSGILYKTRIDKSQLPKGYSLSSGRGTHPKPDGYLTFGSSGFLYRSNKLMYDRNSDTLWHQLWGTPAFGPLVGSGIKLKALPVTLTTWKIWYAEHPDTKVMDINTGFKRDYLSGSPYREYFDSPYTMFPVWQRKDLLPTKSWVFTQLIEGHPKAYPLSVIKEELVINDILAGQNIVIIHDKGGYGAKAYERGKHTFTAVTAKNGPQVISDESGNKWQVTESGLVNVIGKKLSRLPGHMAFWFGWFSFYPKTEVYGIN